MIPNARPPASADDESNRAASDRTGDRFSRPLRLALSLLPSLYLVFGLIWWQASRTEQPLWATWPRPQTATPVLAALPEPSPPPATAPTAVPTTMPTTTPTAVPTVMPTAGPTFVSDGETAAPVTAYPTDQVSLRAEPSSRSDRLATLTPSDHVELLDVVSGEVAEADEARWAKVRYGDLVGYIYWPYLTWPGKS